MTDNTDAASTAVAPELKSTDTRLHVNDQPAKNEPVKPQGEVKIEAAKPAPVVAETQEVALEGAETDASNAASPDKGKEQRLPRWMKERLERVRQVTEAETRAAMLKEVQTVPATQPEPASPANVEQPKTLADFDFDQDAYFDYKVERKLQEKETAAKRESEAKEQAKAAETFKARVDAFEEKVGAGAWEDITTSPLNTDPAFKPLVDMILGEDHDLEIAHHLASNPDELTRIAGLTPLARARELAKLADSFGEPAPTANAPVVPPKKTTNAPPPPKTVSGAGKGAIDVNSPTISSADRIAAWRAGRK
jgi:hypothetical protein